MSGKREEKWFPKNYEQILTLKIFGPSHSIYIYTMTSEGNMKRGEKWFPKASSPNYEKIIDFENFPKNYEKL